MKWYEIVWEIFNQCPNNQMRDIFIEEAQIADVESYIIGKVKDKEISMEKMVKRDGTIIVDVYATGTHERFSFTEID